MAYTSEQTQTLDDILADATPTQRSHFYELAPKLELHQFESVKRLAVICKSGMFRLLSSLPDTVVKNVDETSRRLGITADEYIEIALKGKYPQLMGYPAQTITHRITTIAHLFNVDEARVLHAVKLRPSIISKKPETLLANTVAFGERFGIGREAAVKLCIAYPVIPTLSLDTMDATITRSSELLGIDKAALTKIAVRETSIFAQKPEKLRERLEAGARVMGMELEDYIPLLMKRPTLWSMNPETIRSNIERSSQLLGIGKDDFIAMAKRQPVLPTLKPESLEAQMHALSNVIGIGTQEFMDVAKKYPPILTLAPENVARHAGFIARAYRGQGQEADIPQIAKARASDFARSDAALIGRVIVSQKGLIDTKPNRIIRKNNDEIQQAITGHYAGRLTGDKAKDMKVERTLQQLHRLGVIQDLPADIQPMAPDKGR